MSFNCQRMRPTTPSLASYTWLFLTANLETRSTQKTCSNITAKTGGAQVKESFVKSISCTLIL